MSLLTIILLNILWMWLVVPYFLCIIMKFALWKYQFTSKPSSPFSLTSYKDIMLRVPIGLNQNILISIKHISFKFWPIIKISLQGLSISILIKNEFSQWKNHQIELFKMLDDIRIRLKRNGMLSENTNINMVLTQLQRNISLSDDAIQPISNLQGTQAGLSGVGIASNIPNRQQNDSIISGVASSSVLDGVRSGTKKQTFIQRTLRNLLSSTQIELENTQINFYLYKDQCDQKNDEKLEENFPDMFKSGDGKSMNNYNSKENQKQKISKSKADDEDMLLDYQNIRKFCQVLNSRCFLEKNLCFRLFFPNGEIKLKAIQDDDLDLSIKGSKCLLLNPCYKHKQGLLQEFEIIMKLPTQTKMLKFVGNYDIMIKIQKANLDLNKKFLKKFIKWFVNLYTLIKIIKVAKNIILKTHYQDEILKTQSLNSSTAGTMAFENYRDTQIPKRLKISVVEGIDLIITDECKKLFPFLDNRWPKANLQDVNPPQSYSENMKMNSGINNADKLKQEFSMVKLEKTTFELLRKMQNTYYIIVRTDKGNLSVNQNFDALQIEGFTQEIDFTFRKELTDLPVKKTVLVVDCKINIDLIKSNLTASLFNYTMEIMNMVKAMVWTSSVKAKINGMLLDEDFLKNNVLLINQQKVGTEYERKILQLYKPILYQDQMSASIKLKDLKLKFDRQVCQEGAGQTTNDSLKGLVLNSTNFEFLWSQAHGKINQVLSLNQLSIVPIQNRNSKFIKPPHENMPQLALFACKNLNYEVITHLSETRRKKEQYISANKIQLNVNYEVFLDMSPEFIDLWFIQQQFKNKWGSKYKIKDQIPCDVIKRKIQIDEFTFIWNLSSSRFINFDFVDISSVDEYFRINNTDYVQADGQSKFIIKCKKGSMHHFKQLNENIDEFYRCCYVPIQNYVITGNGQGLSNSNKSNKQEKYKEQILAAEDIEIRFETDKELQSVKISGQKAQMDLPDNYHFSAVIYEMDKQYFHGKNWYSENIKKRQQETDFRFKNWKNQSFIVNNESAQIYLQKLNPDAELSSKPKSLKISIHVKNPLFTIEENKLKKVFLDKSEAVEIMSQRHYLRVKQKSFEKFWDQFQKNNLNDKYIYVKGKNLLMQFELPKDFKSKEYTLNYIKSLDEGRNFITPETFVAFKPGVHTFKIDYLFLMARNMLRPLVELRGFNWVQTFIMAEVNPIQNLELFTCYLKNKIFQRFEMPKLFNKLLSKQYYDSKIDIQKLKINIQGQQSLLFANDIFQQIISKFIYEDISRGRDPNKKYLKYLMSVDRQRARMHGQLKLSILNMQMSIYAKRNFNRYDQYFQIIFSDFIYHQVYQKQQICLRDFIIKKEPLQQFETLFVKLPIVEVKYQVDYNDGKTLNHFFNQQNVETMEDWLQRVKSFMSKSQSVDIKLNIPSLGSINETQSKCLYLPLLLQSYAENSPIPLVHYQRSHMQFFDDFMREFQANRIDISTKVYKKMQLNSIGINKRYTLNFMPQQLEKSKTRFKGFISDIVYLMSDFKEEIGFGMDIKGGEAQENDIFGGLTLDEQFISPEEINDHQKKDAYLTRYNGIIFQNENVCVQSEFTYRPNHVNYFEINDSLVSFNLFRLSKMQSKNLFKIRHPCFNNYRSILFEKSINNYSQFCGFFDLDEHKALQNNYLIVKNKFPQYDIPPVEQIEQEMAITDNLFYNLALGNLSTRQFQYDPSLKYKQLLGNFKTLFPKYILTNEQIQKYIQKKDHEQFQQNDLNLEQDIVDDFIFSENDTIGTVIHSEYRQDQQIKYKSLKKDDKLNQKTKSKVAKDSEDALSPQQLIDYKQEYLNENGEGQEDILHIKHLIEIRGVRFLYTKKIIELIYHHLVKGFDYKQFRKTDYIDLEGELNDNRNIFLEFDNAQAGRRKDSSSKNRMINFKALKQEAIIALRLEQAQINFQDNLTESQMLIASPHPVICVIFAYYKNKAPSLLQNEQIQFLRKKNLNEISNLKNKELQEEFELELKNLMLELDRTNSTCNKLSQDQVLRIKSLKQSVQKREGIMRGYVQDPLNRDSLSFLATTATYTGYQFSTNKDIIKYEMEVTVQEMDLYVAPTFINLENPTFWMNQRNIIGLTQRSKQQSNKNPFSRTNQNGFQNFQEQDSFNLNQENTDGENLLRKIIFANNISFNFDFLKQEFVDEINPSLKLDIIIERLEGQMNGSEWWRFYHIIEQIMLSRGEKAAEVVLIENRRNREMKRMKTEFIRDIINSKLKNQYKEQQNEIKPDITKSLTYSIIDSKFKLSNQNKLFSIISFQGIHGKTQIFSNRESKQDIDIDRVTIENLLDGDNFKWVLYPGDNITNPSILGNRGPPRTMIQVRFKDKFIVVSEAPWRVYDQVELDIFPSSIQLTRNLYLQFKMFMFDNYYSKRNKLALESAINKKKGENSEVFNNFQQDKKYQLLVPTKVQSRSSFFKSSNSSIQSQKDLINLKNMNQNDANIIKEELKQQDSNLNLEHNRGAACNDKKPPSPGSAQEKKLNAYYHPEKMFSGFKFDNLISNTTRGFEVKQNLMQQNEVPHQSQNIFQVIASQREQISSQNQLTFQNEQKNLQHKKQEKENKQDVIAADFPVFFKYFRMNEISMTITYFHEKSSFLNSKDLKIQLAPFISHYKFLPFKRMFDNYELHCKKMFISQIPNILKQKFLKAKQKVDEVALQGVTNSLMQGVSRVRDLAVGQITVQKKLKEQNIKKSQKAIKKMKMIRKLEKDPNEPNQTNRTDSKKLAEEGQKDDSAEQSESDVEDELTKKYKDQFLQEIKETKLREARKILFGDFAIL